jgi:hypothetical protein
MQPHPHAQALGHSTSLSESPPKSLSDKSSLDKSSLDKSGEPSISSNWRRTGAFTGVAAMASAGIVLPLVGEASAFSGFIGESNESATQERSNSTSSSRLTATDYAREQAVSPQITLTNSAAGFSSGAASGEWRSRNAAGSAARENAFQPQQSEASSAPLIVRDNAGNWALSYGAQAGGAQAGGAQANTQAVVTQLAQDTSRSQQDCQDRDCKGLAYIEENLPAARLRVQALQQELLSFEAANAQQDMSGYQKVLTDRTAEIAQQKTQLAGSLEQTRQTITQLKMRLVTVGADLGLADQILQQDNNYQIAWAKLQESEKKLLEEFSRLNLDATTLNGVYTDYQYNQQWLQQMAQESLGSYLKNPDTVAPDFVYQAPAALDVLQNLVMLTHQYQVQHLRQGTIAQIEQRLQAHQNQLVGNLGQYEPLKRELAAAEQVVRQYEQERDQILTRRQQAAQGTLSEERSPAIAQARQLAPRLPEGSVAAILLGVVVTAGAIATAAVQRQRKEPTYEAGSVMLTIQPFFDSSMLGLYGEERYEEDLDPFWLDEPGEGGIEVSSSREDRLLAELMAMTGGQPARALPALRTETDGLGSHEMENDLAIEVMSRELKDVLSKATAEANFADEVSARLMPPVQLSLADIDLFAEHAIRWVLQDSEIEPVAIAPQAPAPTTQLQDKIRDKVKDLQPIF